MTVAALRRREPQTLAALLDTYVIVGISAEKDGHTFGAVYELPLRIAGPV